MMPLVYLDYQVRKDFIATVLCINKDKPEMRCQGKCHLRKQLTKAHNQKTDKKSPALSKNNFEIYHHILSTFYLESVIYSEIILPIPPYQFSLNATVLETLFHPPETLS